jgi:hypothetical protein
MYLWFKKSLPVWTTINFPFGIQELFEEVVREVYPGFKVSKSLEDAQVALAELDSNLEEKAKVEAQRNSKSTGKSMKPTGLENIAESMGKQKDLAFPDLLNRTIVSFCCFPHFRRGTEHNG